MPENDELRYRNRPAFHEIFELRGELAPVGRDVEAAVVVQVDRRIPEVVRERSTVIVPFALPVQVVHAQAMQEYDQLAVGLRDRRGQRRTPNGQRDAVAAQTHMNGQRIAGRCQVVAEHAIERGQQCAASRPVASLA
jgi:hypothetical protein